MALQKTDMIMMQLPTVCCVMCHIRAFWIFRSTLAREIFVHTGDGDGVAEAAGL